MMGEELVASGWEAVEVDIDIDIKPPEQKDSRETKNQKGE